jgi:2-keto-4-pentenoate hydratase
LKQHGNRPATAAVTAKAREFAEAIRPIIEDIEAAGITSNRGIAAELNQREIMNARGGTGRWTDTTVARLRARLAAGSRGR